MIGLIIVALLLHGSGLSTDQAVAAVLGSILLGAVPGAYVGSHDLKR